MSDEQKENIRKANAGKPLSEERKRKISESLKGQPGRPHTEETKEKIRQANLGRTFSEETIEKMRQAALNRPPFSEETKKKMSESRKGRPAWNKGIPASEKTKKKISEALKGKFAEEKHYAWRGEEASYSAKHTWVNKYWGKAQLCELEPTHKGPYEWHNISEEYKRDRSDWLQICKSCHQKIHVCE
jgi:hypothetical protein